MTQEGALIAFTLLSQLVAGSTILYSILYFTRRDEVVRFPSGFHVKTPELLLLLLLLVAISISFLHLGNARQAGRALNNLGSSWISWEILSLAVFSLSLFFLFLGRWLMPVRSRMLSVLYLFAPGSGAALIIVMIRLYMIPAVPSWNSWYTPSSFMLASLILGMCTLLAYMVTGKMNGYSFRLFLQIFFLLLLLEALISAGNQYMLDHLPITHYNSFILENIHWSFTIIRITLITSVLVLLVFIRRNRTIHASTSLKRILMISAILMVLVEQIAGRWLFFASYVKVGI